MNTEQSKTILISLVGATPAVLTETVWALATQPEPVLPDRIIAITTSSGSAQLKEKLFSDGHWDRMLADLSIKGIDWSGKLQFGNIGDSIRVFPDLNRTRELDDIRTAEDNEAVAEFFMEVVRSFTENDSVELITSIAGGRKTTSALLHSVMTLLGRAQDRINHILINDEWIYQPDFLYPGCTGTFFDRDTKEPLDSRNAELQLVDVPFVPLRYLFKRDIEKSASSFLDLIHQVRTRSINVDDDLVVQLDTARADIIITGKKISLSPNEFLLYLFFAHRAIEGEPPVDSYAAVGEPLKDLKAEYLVEDNFGHWSQQALSNQFDPGEDLRKWASSIRKKLRNAEFEPFQVDRLVPNSSHFGIQIPPDGITIDG